MNVLSKSATEKTLVLEGNDGQELLAKLVNLGVNSFTVSTKEKRVALVFSREIDFYTALGIVQYYKNEPNWE